MHLRGGHHLVVSKRVRGPKGTDGNLVVTASKEPVEAGLRRAMGKSSRQPGRDASYISRSGNPRSSFNAAHVSRCAQLTCAPLAESCAARHDLSSHKASPTSGPANGRRGYLTFAPLQHPHPSSHSSFTPNPDPTVPHAQRVGRSSASEHRRREARSGNADAPDVGLAETRCGVKAGQSNVSEGSRWRVAAGRG